MNQDQNRANEIRPGLQLPAFTGKSLFSVKAHNLVARCVTSLLNLKVHVIDSANQIVQEAKVLVSDAGTDVYLNAASAGGSGGGGGTQQLIVASFPGTTIPYHRPDYIGCYDYTGGTIGNQLLFVAKPPFLRYSIFDLTIDGNNVTFVYDTPDPTTGCVTGFRASSFSTPLASDQNEVISRPYNSGDIIYASTVTGGVKVRDGVGTTAPNITVQMQDQNPDCRDWVFQYGQV